LDNCEHLIGTCAALVDYILRACPRLHVLATSREPLRIHGEMVWDVSPLSVPTVPQDIEVDIADRSEAVQLFVQRAQLVQPWFQLTDDNASAVAELCTRLDGLPLAIELAAAWAPVLSPAQIAARLDDRFRLLRHGSRAGPYRHHTLEATLDWSYRLLSAR